MSVNQCAALAVGWLGRHSLPPFRRDRKHVKCDLAIVTRTAWPNAVEPRLPSPRSPSRALKASSRGLEHMFSLSSQRRLPPSQHARHSTCIAVPTILLTAFITIYKDLEKLSMQERAGFIGLIRRHKGAGTMDYRHGQCRSILPPKKAVRPILSHMEPLKTHAKLTAVLCTNHSTSPSTPSQPSCPTSPP